MLTRILVVSLADCWHICSCIYHRYYPQFHCLFTTSFGAVGGGLASWRPRIEGRWGSVGIPQGDVHKSLTRHKQQIFSYRIQEVVSLKSLHLSIGPDIDPVCPTSNSFDNIVIESSWMGAIWRPWSIQAGKAELLFARLYACRLFWHPALTKL